MQRCLLDTDSTIAAISLLQPVAPGQIEPWTRSASVLGKHHAFFRERSADSTAQPIQRCPAGHLVRTIYLQHTVDKLLIHDLLADQIRASLG
jgi:hypothetical protein